MSCFVLWMGDTGNSNSFINMDEIFIDRMETLGQLFIASVTFLYVAAESLPKVPYLTCMDHLTILTFINILLIGSETMTMKLHCKYKNIEQARNLNKNAQFFLPIFLSISKIGACLHANWLAKEYEKKTWDDADDNVFENLNLHEFKKAKEETCTKNQYIDNYPPVESIPFKKLKKNVGIVDELKKRVSRRSKEKSKEKSKKK